MHSRLMAVISTDVQKPFNEDNKFFVTGGKSSKMQSSVGEFCGCNEYSSCIYNVFISYKQTL